MSVENPTNWAETIWGAPTLRDAHAYTDQAIHEATEELRDANLQLRLICEQVLAVFDQRNMDVPWERILREKLRAALAQERIRRNSQLIIIITGPTQWQH